MWPGCCTRGSSPWGESSRVSILGLPAPIHSNALYPSSSRNDSFVLTFPFPSPWSLQVPTSQPWSRPPRQTKHSSVTHLQVLPCHHYKWLLNNTFSPDVPTFQNHPKTFIIFFVSHRIVNFVSWFSSLGFDLSCFFCAMGSMNKHLLQIIIQNFNSYQKYNNKKIYLLLDHIGTFCNLFLFFDRPVVFHFVVLLIFFKVPSLSASSTIFFIWLRLSV